MSELSVLRVRRQYTASEKRAILARQKESGKRIIEFCREENVAVSSFHQWKKRYATPTSPIAHAARTTKTPLFAEVFLADAIQKYAVPVRITLPSGESVDTSSDCDPGWLGKVCQSLRSASC